MKIVANYKLPKEITDSKVDPKLLSQAVRVSLANLRQGTQSALTRAEVNRTRKKFQKQKGSGNARHGDKKSPIFVGGGVSFAPKPRDYSLNLPAKMKKLAVVGSFAAKAKEGKVLVVSGLAEVSGKTKEIVEFIKESGLKTEKILLVTDGYNEKVYQAARNIDKVTILPVEQLNAYETLKADVLVIDEKAIGKIKLDKKAKKEEVVKVFEKPLKIKKKKV